jgi:hypothetical protein
MALGHAVQVREGEFVPAVLTVELGRRGSVSVPMGAFTVRDGKPRFVATVDVVGLSATVLGIGVARLGLRTLRPVALAVADRLRRA